MHSLPRHWIKAEWYQMSFTPCLKSHTHTPCLVVRCPQSEDWPHHGQPISTVICRPLLSEAFLFQVQFMSLCCPCMRFLVFLSLFFLVVCLEWSLSSSSFLYSSCVTNNGLFTPLTRTRQNCLVWSASAVWTQLENRQNCLVLSCRQYEQAITVNIKAPYCWGSIGGKSSSFQMLWTCIGAVR